MKLNCGLPADERAALKWKAKKAYLEQWHPFFALWPRRVGPTQCVWLEWIRRKGTWCEYQYHGAWWRYEYRLSIDKEILG